MHDCKTIFRIKVQTSLAFSINSLLIGLWPYSQGLKILAGTNTPAYFGGAPLTKKQTFYNINVSLLVAFFLKSVLSEPCPQGAISVLNLNKYQAR